MIFLIYFRFEVEGVLAIQGGSLTEVLEALVVLLSEIRAYMVGEESPWLQGMALAL